MGLGQEIRLLRLRSRSSSMVGPKPRLHEGVGDLFEALVEDLLINGGGIGHLRQRRADARAQLVEHHGCDGWRHCSRTHGDRPASAKVARNKPSLCTAPLLMAGRRRGCAPSASAALRLRRVWLAPTRARECIRKEAALWWPRNAWQQASYSSRSHDCCCTRLSHAPARPEALRRRRSRGTGSCEPELNGLRTAHDTGSPARRRCTLSAVHARLRRRAERQLNGRRRVPVNALNCRPCDEPWPMSRQGLSGNRMLAWEVLRCCSHDRQACSLCTGFGLSQAPGSGEPEPGRHDRVPQCCAMPSLAASVARHVA